MDGIERWQEAVAEVSQQILHFPDRATNPWINAYPRASCSVASFTIGRLLLERHDELWMVRSGKSDSGSHTWLVRPSDDAGSAAIDATLHQFEDIAKSPFIGHGLSPAENYFRGEPPIHVGLIPPGWHHGQTHEIYGWLFPRLGLSRYDPTVPAIRLMPDSVLNPPVRILVRKMVTVAERTWPNTSFAICVSGNNAQTLKMLSDEVFGVLGKRSNECFGQSILANPEIDDDSVVLVPRCAESSNPDHAVLIGNICVGKFESVRLSNLLADQTKEVGKTA